MLVEANLASRLGLADVYKLPSDDVYDTIPGWTLALGGASAQLTLTQVTSLEDTYQISHSSFWRIYTIFFTYIIVLPKTLMCRIGGVPLQS